MKFILILFLFVVPLEAQIFNIQLEDSSWGDENLFPFIVDSIEIKGNETTERFIITRELTFEKGDTLNQKIINYNKERIYSLGIFNHVRLLPFGTATKNILLIEVEESWYIYPIPFASLKDNDWEKLSYGMFVRIENFRGRNETLTGSFSLGYDPSFSVNYFNPNIIGREDYFFNAKVSYVDAANKSDIAEEIFGGEFSQKIITGELTFGKRIDLFHKPFMRAGFNYIETPFFIKGINASDERIDKVLFLGLGYEYDTRDLAQFPSNGILASVSYFFKGLGINEIDYRIAAIDFREYRNFIGDLIAKWRLAARFTFGNLIPYYDYSFLGLGDRVRGHFNDQQEGNHLYLASLELDYPIIEELKISLEFIPIIPKELLSYRVGLHAHIFADAGTTNFKNEPLVLNDFDSGYGLGMSLLILPHNVLRIELGFDEQQNTEWIFDLGVSF